jgi:formate hydrogenlyase subunit 4
LGFDFPSLLINLLLLIFLPPLLPGIINRVKAWMAGRQGAPVFQLYYDLDKLFRKGSIYSQSTSMIFRWSPLVSMAALLTAGIFFPLAGKSIFSFEGDLILFVYLLGLSRFATILAAWDVGSSFEGMGASREAIYGALAELPFLTGLLALAVFRHSFSMGHIFQSASGVNPFHPGFVLLFVSFFFVLLCENSRMPVDDPNTHLELTMIHEVMILDYSGPELGWVLYGASVKLMLHSLLLASILWPIPALGVGWAVAMSVLKAFGVALLVGMVESLVARLRLMVVPQFLLANFMITILAFLVIFFGKGF